MTGFVFPNPFPCQKVPKTGTFWDSYVFCFYYSLWKMHFFDLSHEILFFSTEIFTKGQKKLSPSPNETCPFQQFMQKGDLGWLVCGATHTERDRHILHIIHTYTHAHSHTCVPMKAKMLDWRQDARPLPQYFLPQGMKSLMLQGRALEAAFLRSKKYYLKRPVPVEEMLAHFQGVCVLGVGSIGVWCPDAYLWSLKQTTQPES